jgi:hypothetical protein
MKLLMAVLALFMIVGCSSEPTKPVETEKPKPKGSELVTGRTAFQKLYVAAHGWAPDAQAYHLESQITAEAKGKDGKSAVWRASFASASRRAVKPYVWSGIDAADAPSRGISPGS